MAATVVLHILLLLAGTAQVTPISTTGVNIMSHWNENGKIKIEAEVDLKFPCNMNSWKVLLEFSENAIFFENWNGNGGEQCVNSVSCELTNKYGGSFTKGNSLKFKFHVMFDRSSLPESLSARWTDDTCNGQVTPGPTQPGPGTPPGPVTRPPGGSAKYDYGEVLRQSILFYEAQRSGRLPANRRVKWRGDSALNDKGQNGEDLTGGWYDAGDHVKFNFPMASAVTLLAWGMVRYKEAYQSAGQWQYALDSIKWPLDYFIKCHVSDNVIYGQVGKGDVDHANWGRPEDMNMHRPAYQVNAGRPGSDLAGEMAAAMAAGYLVFRDEDAGYAANLLNHAKQMYKFATTYRGKYSDSITDARSYYGSSNYIDELSWSAAWMHKATKENHYLEQAKTYVNQLSPGELSWDDKGIGALLLMYEADGFSAAKERINNFVTTWLNMRRTPKGLAWLRKWGPNRYAANAAFALQVAGELGIRSNECFKFVETQINYMLGDAGRSFVCGFGNNPPQRPHHKASSCPPYPAGCGWNDYHNPRPNPHVLHGALVGGPDQNDNYTDDRKDYVSNEVANDYNAGFQSAVAGLLARFKKTNSS